jgi:hypothetical protein
MLRTVMVKCMHVKTVIGRPTGWGGESWTIFCGPAAVAIGAVSGKISEIR